MNYSYEYGRQLLILNIIGLYQKLEGEFDEESISLCEERLSLKNDSELILEYGKYFEFVYDK